MIYEIDNKEIVSGIFGDWNETIIWSCLQGVMGHIYADDKCHWKESFRCFLMNIVFG